MLPVTNQLNAVLVLKDYEDKLSLYDLSLATISLYKQRLSRFLDFLGDSNPSAELARLFLADLRVRRYARSTIRGYYCAIKLYLAWLDITLEVKFKREKRLPRYHSHKDIARLLAAVARRTDTWSKLKGRDQLIIKLLAGTGLRRAELISLRRRDIRDGYLTVYHGKGEKDRAIPLTGELSLELSNYIDLNRLTPSDRLFPVTPQRVWQVITGYARRVGIDDLSPHGLRHYFATRLVEKGAAISALQQLLGHADISTTAVYLDVIPAHLKATIELLEED
jgi:site-specific recombinase XerD